MSDEDTCTKKECCCKCKSLIRLRVCSCEKCPSIIGGYVCDTPALYNKDERIASHIGHTKHGLCEAFELKENYV